MIAGKYKIIIALLKGLSYINAIFKFDYLIDGQSKMNILIYTGHGEILGGDVKFILDTLKHINYSKFNITLVTDINYKFSELITKEPSSVKVEYINTRPILYQKNIVDKVYLYCKKSKNVNWFAKVLYSLMNINIKERKIYRYMRILYQILTFKLIRDRINNIILFNNFFKNRANDFDVFHFNNGGYPAKEAGLISILFARLYKIKKIILSIHNMPQKRSLRYPSRYIFDALIPRYCNVITAPSQKCVESLSKINRSFKEKTTLCYCGIKYKALYTPNEIANKKLELNLFQKVPILLLVGNYEETRKGHHIAIKALPNIVSFFPHVKLLFVGSGSNTRKDYLLKLAAQYKIEKNLLFLGPRSDIHELNSIADIILVPSLDFEATPFTIKEGARAAKVVITTSAGGCAEGIIPNKSGIVIEPNNVLQLETAILNLLNNPQKAKAMGVENRHFFKRKFTLNKQINFIEALYSAEIVK